MVRVGVSGSTVLSESDRLDELFWDGIDHVEVGDLSASTDLDTLLTHARQQSISVGFHSPLFKGGSKYDLLTQVQQSPEQAWHQLEEELGIAQDNQVEYVLVHFPYFPLASEDYPIPQIEVGLNRLRSLQASYGTKVLCEPKLGIRRDPGGIGILKFYPVDQWREFGVLMCWDMGDYLLASETLEECLVELRRWRDVIDALHVHNVKVTSEKYYWVPVHPSYEDSEDFFTIKPLLSEIKEMNALLVWEHTPHFTPDHGFVLEGLQWVKGILGLASDNVG